MKRSEDERTHDGRELDISEELLETVFGEMPPDAVVSAANPSSVGMDRIITGIALSSITLNFLALNYILPTIGAVLLLLGFRNLRGESRWFKMAFICSIADVILMIPQLIVNATIFRAHIPEAVERILGIGSCGIRMSMLFAFWMAIRKVQKKAVAEGESCSAGALFIWYSLLLSMAAIGFSGVIAAVIMIIAFVMILKSLSALLKRMEAEGYLIEATPVRLSDGVLAKSIAGILLIGIAAGYLFCSGYPMRWNPAEPVETAGEVYEHLLALGYPEKQLRDLAPSELELLKAADCVVTETDRRTLNSEAVEAEYSASATEELTLTHVAVRIAGDGAEGERWRVIHHFAIDDALKTRGTVSLDIWPSVSHESWGRAEDLSGRLLCRKNGTELTADFASTGQQFRSAADFWGNIRETEDCLWEFSLPSRAADRRGYVAYSLEQLEDGMVLSAWVNYTWQVGFFQYPVKTAGEYFREGIHIKDYPYATVQSAIQFYVKGGAPYMFE